MFISFQINILSIRLQHVISTSSNIYFSVPLFMTCVSQTQYYIDMIQTKYREKHLLQIHNGLVN